MNAGVVIVGGGPVGVLAALTDKSVYLDTSVFMVKSKKI